MMLRSDNYMNQYLFYIKQQSWGKLLFDFIKHIRIYLRKYKNLPQNKGKVQINKLEVLLGIRSLRGLSHVSLKACNSLTHKHSTRTKWASFPPSCSLFCSGIRGDIWAEKWVLNNWWMHLITGQGRKKWQPPLLASDILQGHEAK